MAEGLLADQAPAFAAATVGANHFGVGPRLVDEDQCLRIKTGLGRLPALARLGHVRPGLLGRMQSFF